MRLKTAFIALMTFLTCALTASAVEVTVKMNAVSTTMSMKSKATGEDVAVGDVNKMQYTFTAPPGDYVITGYAKDGKTVNGTIDVCVGDSVKQQITVLTLTAYVSNKTNGTTWTVDNGDYTIDVKVNSREGVQPSDHARRERDRRSQDIPCPQRRHVFLRVHSFESPCRRGVSDSLQAATLS